MKTLKVYREDVITIALLLRKKYAGTDMVSLKTIEEYEEIINSNLERTDYQCRLYAIFSDCKIYSIFRDENGELYAVITDYEKLDRAEMFFYRMPSELYTAINEENALSVIKLTRQKDSIKQKKKI